MRAVEMARRMRVSAEMAEVESARMAADSKAFTAGGAWAELATRARGGRSA